jgi:hypothetical protein
MVLAVASLAGCARTDTEATPDSPAAAPTPTISLADVAGTWNMTGKNEAGDSTLVTYVMTATADMNGWSIKFADRPDPVPVRVVMVDGDSIVIEAGPYQSVLRPGVNVATHAAIRMQNGMLAGMTIARYSVQTADSVRMVRIEGTRAP